MSDWSSKEEQHYIHATFRYLTLEFFSETPMSWISSASIAIDLLMANQAGHTGMFNMRFVNSGTGVVIWAHLRTQLVAAVA